MKQLLLLAVDAALYFVALPVFFIRYTYRRIAALLPSAFDGGAVRCPTCTEPIPTARMNRCSCGYVSVSSLIAPCEFCGAGPFRFIECVNCGATVRLF